MDAMNDDNKTNHDDAEAIRAETAADSPELAEHDMIADLQRQLEEANDKALYAAADTLDVAILSALGSR